MGKTSTKASARTKTKASARGKRSPMRRSAARKAAAKPGRKHKFVVSHLRDGDFKSDGLRSYAQYRDLGIKDMSQAIPGHGGFMDRLDSLLINAVVAWVAFQWMGV